MIASIINNISIAAAEVSKVIEKAPKVESTVSDGAVIVLITGCLILYGGLSICLMIAVKKSRALEQEEKDAQVEDYPLFSGKFVKVKFDNLTDYPSTYSSTTLSNCKA